MGLGYGLEGNAGAYGNKLGYAFQLKYFSLPNANHEEKVQNAMANCIYPEEAAHEDDETKSAYTAKMDMNLTN